MLTEVTAFELPESSEYTTFPVGKLGIIALPGCEELAERIDKYIVRWRAENETMKNSPIKLDGYNKDSYIIDAKCARFGSGEGKAVINGTVRGYDIFILMDAFNYGVTYKMYGMEVPMSPDDHFANLKRVISAIGGKAHRITVVMPMLYEGRQHKRSSRESLDCAMALQEITRMGVDSVITFDAHDPRIQNAELRGNCLIATIDRVPCTIALSPTVVDAYNQGALPLNTLANAVLAKNDQMKQMAQQNYRDNEAQQTTSEKYAEGQQAVVRPLTQR